MEPIKIPQINPAQVAEEIEQFIVQKVLTAGATGGVIGLSGGIDSTVSATLTKRGFDSYNQAQHPRQPLELIGYSIPSSLNSGTDNDDGKKVADKLGIRYDLINIEPVVIAYEATNPEAFLKDYDRGNMISRIRANVLNTKAASERKLVIGTGNKDEDFGIGYYTLFGDGAVHMSPIGGLPKRLVREMAVHLGFDDYFVNREPSAGLEPGQTDFKDLGYTYDAVEIVSEGLNQGFNPNDLYEHPQVIDAVQPHLEVSKFESVDQVVDDIIHRHYQVAKPKADMLHPSVADITLRYR